MRWGLAITNPAKRRLGRLSQPERKGLNRAFSLMCGDPFQGDIKFLPGGNDTMRRSVGDLQIFYELHQEDKVIIITAVERRGSNTY